VLRRSRKVKTARATSPRQQEGSKMFEASSPRFDPFDVTQTALIRLGACPEPS
jgi:hypothetical protein